MKNDEIKFNINQVLKETFSAVKELDDTKNIEIIFEMHSTLPREFKGDVVKIKKLLKELLGFIYLNTAQREIVLSINAPKDFVYEELVIFTIKESAISREKIITFLKSDILESIDTLEGIVVDDEYDVHIEIPFTLAELGFRRHYRLPSRSMLQKKVLLIIESENVTSSITKMFKYFPYDVDLGFKAYKMNNIKLSEYDVVVIEDNLVTESFKYEIEAAEKIKKLKFVILGENASDDEKQVSACLIKPITQETIFELIVFLFNDDHKTLANNEMTEDNTNNEHAQRIGKRFNEKMGEYMHASDEVLNISKGLEITEEKGLVYSDELQKFLEIFGHSDLYFREIINVKSENKIKMFCKDLQNHSMIIGADSMLKFTETINLILSYNQLEILPIYPGRYHIELEKLMKEIKIYLDIE